MKPPTFRRILARHGNLLGWTIHIGMLWVLVGALMLVIFFQDAALGREESWALLIVSLLTLAHVVQFVYRARQIRRVFSVGEVVAGRVVQVGWDESRLADSEARHSVAIVTATPFAVVAYEYAGRKYQIKCPGKTRGGGGIRAGKKVTLVVDPAKPSRAFLVSIFL